MILVLDNRDSFTFNLVQALENLGAEVLCRRAEDLDLEQAHRIAPDRILIGPGPGRPEEAQLSLEILRDWGAPIPILGICLGHQALAVAFGGRIERAQTLIHGWAVAVQHDGLGLFEGLPQSLQMARYNSLAVVDAELPNCLEVTARDPKGEILGLRHRQLPIEGLQFHPESILSSHGDKLLEAFLKS